MGVGSGGEVDRSRAGVAAVVKVVAGPGHKTRIPKRVDVATSKDSHVS
jgi:hypothetical protein